MEKLDSVLAILALKVKGTVTLMTNVRKVSDVDQTIVQLHLDLMCTQIAVLMPVLEMRIFAQLTFLVKLMKVIAIPMMNAKAICFVDLTIVQVPSDFYLQLIAVNLKVINHYVLRFAQCPCNCPYLHLHLYNLSHRLYLPYGSKSEIYDNGL